MRLSKLSVHAMVSTKFINQLYPTSCFKKRPLKKCNILKFKKTCQILEIEKAFSFVCLTLIKDSICFRLLKKKITEI